MVPPQRVRCEGLRCEGLRLQLRLRLRGNLLIFIFIFILKFMTEKGVDFFFFFFDKGIDKMGILGIFIGLGIRKLGFWLNYFFLFFFYIFIFKKLPRR